MVDRSQIITLADLIRHELAKEHQEKTTVEPVSHPEDYEVYPEEDNYDRPRNPYSRV